MEEVVGSSPIGSTNFPWFSRAFLRRGYVLYKMSLGPFLNHLLTDLADVHPFEASQCSLNFAILAAAAAIYQQIVGTSFRGDSF